MQTYASTGDATLISSDGKASLAALVFDSQVEQAQQQVDRIQAQLRPDGLTAYITGEPAIYQALEKVSASDLRRAETYALPFALIVLVLVFGSVVAAALPVIGGGMAVTVTLGVLYLLAQRFSLSIFTMNVASLLGLAVGIDYSLFIVGRFREELARGGERRRRRRDDGRPRRAGDLLQRHRRDGRASPACSCSRTCRCARSAWAAPSSCCSRCSRR